MHLSKQDCCEANFGWILDICLASDPNAGATNKWWSVGIGNETSDGMVTLSLYEPGGQP